MNEERIIYWRVGREIWQGTEVKVTEAIINGKNSWWRRPDFELIRICKDEDEAEAMLIELNRTKWVHRLAKVMGVE